MALDASIALNNRPPAAESNPMAGLASLMQLVHLVQQSKTERLKADQLEQTLPLDLEAKIIANKREKSYGELISKFMGGGDGGAVSPASLGVGGISTPGGGQANLLTGEVAPNSAATNPQDDYQRSSKLAGLLAFMKPEVSRALVGSINSQNPDKVREAYALGYRPGTPGFDNLVAGINSPSGVFGAPDRVTGARQLDPNYAASQALIKGAEEDAKAARDLVEVKSTGPNVPPTYRRRSDLIAAAAAANSPQPTPQPMQPQRGFVDPGIPQGQTPLMQAPSIDAARQQAIAMNAAGLPVNVMGRGGNTSPQPMQPSAAPAAPATPFGIPASSVTGVAAGQSPRQEAENAALKEFQVTDAKARSELYSGAQKNAMMVQSKIAKFERIGQLLGAYDGGKLAGTGYELARLGTSLGINIDKNLPNKEAANALTNEVALELRSTADGAGMPGAMSDADREFLKSMAPQLSQTAEGRRKIIESRVLVWKREQYVAEMMRKYKQKNGSIDEDFFSNLQQWSNRNPIFNGN